MRKCFFESAGTGGFGADLISTAEAYAMETAMQEVSQELQRVESEAMHAFADANLMFTPADVALGLNYLLRECSVKTRILEMGGLSARAVFPDIIGWPQNYERVQEIITDFLPCICDIEFYVRVLTWSECHRAYYKWSFANGKTWEEFMKAIP